MIYEKFEKLNDEKHGRVTSSLVGISRLKFNSLAIAFAAAYRAIQQERLLSGEIKQVPSGGPKGYLDTTRKREKPAFLHLVLPEDGMMIGQTYPTFDVLGFHFGFSSGHAHGHLTNLMPVLLRSLSHLGVLPARTPGTPRGVRPTH
jgi:hypothetical protein